MDLCTVFFYSHIFCQDIFVADSNLRSADAELQQRASEYLALSRITRWETIIKCRRFLYWCWAAAASQRVPCLLTYHQVRDDNKMSSFSFLKLNCSSEYLALSRITRWETITKWRRVLFWCWAAASTGTLPSHESPGERRELNFVVFCSRFKLPAIKQAYSDQSTAAIGGFRLLGG